MLQYGYIRKDGSLICKPLSGYRHRYEDNGKIRERIVSVEEQAEDFHARGWKPVEDIDPNKLTVDGIYCTRAVPYDAGDKILYRYERVLDKANIKRQIRLLQDKLSSPESDCGDYRIIKCYEASLHGDELPYDIRFLLIQRQEIRNKINKLQSFFESSDATEMNERF